MPCQQQTIINKVQQVAQVDERISALLMYGSFVKGEGDQYSDVEFYVFCRSPVDVFAWVSQIREVAVFFRNEFGTDVAIFNNFIRGEFHFLPVEQISVIHSWAGYVSFEFADNMNLLDKDGLLAATLAPLDKARPRHDAKEQLIWLAQSLCNNLLLVNNLLCRGELVHACHHFQYIHKYLAWLIRIADKADKHWECPSKGFEREISAQWYHLYAGCFPCLQHDSLVLCLNNAVALGEKICALLAVPDHLLQFLGKLYFSSKNSHQDLLQK